MKPVYDWSGGLIWLETPALTDAGAVEIRRTLAEFGGHGTLIRASDEARSVIDVFQPLDGPLDVTTGLCWAGYANAELRRSIEPILSRCLRELGA